MPQELSEKLLSNRYHGDASKKDVHERDKEFMRRCHDIARFIAARQGWTMVPCSRDGEILPMDTITEDLKQRLSRWL